MKYQPPYQPNWPDVDDPDAPYINGDPSQAQKGSVPPAQAIEFPQREIVHLIQKGGHVPSDEDLYQLTRSARRALYAWGVDTGSANSLSVALDPPLTAYASGLEIRVLVSHDNTAAATIRVNGLSTQQIVKKDGSTLIAGDLRQGGIAVLVHDGTHFQLVSGAAGSTTITDGWFNGADYFADVGTVDPTTPFQMHIVGTPAIAPTAYAAGQGFCVRVKNRNPAAVDVNVNALGAKPLRLPTGNELEEGDLVPNMLIYIRYDGAYFTLLSPIDMAIIEAPVTKIVGPNAGADFPDLIRANAWANRRRIDADGYLTLTLQGQSGTALVHNYTTGVAIGHPDGARLAIQGPGMNFIPTPGNFVTGGNVATEASQNVAMLRTAFQTELRFPATLGLSLNGRIGKIKNFMVAGAGMSSAGCGGIAINGYTDFECVASVFASSSCWSISPNATLSGTNFYGVGSNLFTVGLAHSSNLLVGGAGGSFVIAQSLSDGIQAAHGAIIQIDCQSTRPRIYACSGWGINHWGASSVHMQVSFIRNCAIGGISSSSANSWLYGADISACGRGVVCSQGGMMDANTTTISGNSLGDYIAGSGAYIYAGGFQIGSAQFSPARNTMSGRAYIEG